METVSISVRRLVEFILRAGDIDSAYMSANRAVEGTRVHRHVQKIRKEEAEADGAVYEREAVLDYAAEYKNIRFELKGRADGIRREADGAVTIEEIKSTLGPVETIEDDPLHWHWAQAKSYGYMYMAARRENPDACPAEINIALTYCRVLSEGFGGMKTFTLTFSFEQLKDFFFGLLEKYHAFARMDLDRISERNLTAGVLAFPFGGYRKGQRELAVAVYAAAKQKKKLFAQAPTGIGKTISVLFPVVKAMAEGLGEKCFYLTAKAVARKVAEEAMRKMTDAGLRMRSITLTAKDKICFFDRKCTPEFCPYADGHFNRVNGAISGIIKNETIITREVVETYARAHEVCPMELQLDAAVFSDVIICDYNHAYDPQAKLQRFFAAGGDFILLNDEAHNLIDRSRDMFSAGLYKKDFAELRKKAGKAHPLYKSSGLVSKEISAAAKSGNSSRDLIDALFLFSVSCDEFLKARQNESGLEEDILGAYFKALDYLRVAEISDECYAFLTDPAAGSVKLFCVDPSPQLREAQKKTRACVFFSATLAPIDYFRSLSGGDESDFTLRLASPFPRANLCLLIDTSVSTRYKNRATSYGKISERLYAMVSAKTGNYMAFFPSYAYLNEVYDLFTQSYPGIKVMIQESEMPDEQREKYLEAFKDKPRETLLAFAVLGGAFSEGIDLKGERLSGAAIAGVGLPLICAERDLIAKHFNFDFAYRFPGMNKVLQAAGRVIRTETDRGVVCLMDDRLGENANKDLFPREWYGGARVRSPEDITRHLNNFWSETHDGKDREPD